MWWLFRLQNVIMFRSVSNDLSDKLWWLLKSNRMTGAQISGCDMFRSDRLWWLLKSNRMTGAQISGCDMFRSDRLWWLLKSNRMTGAQISGCDMFRSDRLWWLLKSNRMTGAQISGCDMFRSDRLWWLLKSNRMTGAQISGCDMLEPGRIKWCLEYRKHHVCDTDRQTERQGESWAALAKANATLLSSDNLVCLWDEWWVSSLILQGWLYPSEQCVNQGKVCAHMQSITHTVKLLMFIFQTVKYQLQKHT